MLEEGGGSEKAFTGICGQMVCEKNLHGFHLSPPVSSNQMILSSLNIPRCWFPLSSERFNNFNSSQADHLDITMIDDDNDEKQEKSIIANSDALDVFA